MNAPYILVVDDEPDIRDLVKEILEDEGYIVNVADSARNARIRKAEQAPDLVLLDIWMPGEDGVSLLKDWRDKRELLFPVVMMSGHGTVETAVEATRSGAFDFVEKPLSLAKLLMVVEKALANASNDAQYHPNDQDAEVDPLIGHSEYVVNLRHQIEKLAGTDASVLINGEPASGKGLVIQHIHKQSSRAAKPLVVVHCDKLDKTLATSELFGNERVGTVPKGLLEQAEGGVLYLAEIAGLPITTQSMLLGAIRTKAFLRVGGSSPIPLNVRFCASTSVDLQHLINANQFDEALYHKLNIVPVKTLGLREHAEDIPDLLEYYTDWFVANEGLTYRHFNVATQNRLRNYSWPGNIRELKSLVQRLLIMGNGVEITLDEVEDVLVESANHATDASGLMTIPLDLPLREARAEFERTYLLQQLKATSGSIGELAKRVGVERTHLYRKLRSLGIEVSKQR